MARREHVTEWRNMAKDYIVDKAIEDPAFHPRKNRQALARTVRAITPHFRAGPTAVTGSIGQISLFG